MLHSVKFRLTLWYALILTILLSVFAAFMYTEFSRVLYSDVDRELRNEADSLQGSMDSYLQGVFKGLQIAEEIQFPHFSLFNSPDVRIRLIEIINDWKKTNEQLKSTTNMVRFIGIDSYILLSNLKGWEEEVIFPNYERDNTFMESGESLQTINFNHKPIRLYYKLVQHKNKPLFIIQTGQAIFELDKTLRRLLFVIWITIPGAVIAACLAGWFLARRSLKPIDLMIDQASQIRATYLKGRLSRTNTGDELDRLAATLNDMMDRIESSTNAVRDFSSDVSHELKTPLAIIRGEIDLATRRERSPETLKETLSIIGEEVNGLIRLVDDLMLLVRSDSKQLKFEKKRVSMQQVLTYCFSRYQDRGIEKGIEMSLNANEDIEVMGDTVYLKRMFSNLLDNAIKFTNAGESISVTLSRDADHALVEVADTGMGVEADIQAKVFSRFYRTDQARSKEGAGLGLNIAKAVCDAHAGVIRLSSNTPHGTRVTVRLPIHLS